ncbi:unnamed protein product [Prunus armeniaca]
MDIPEMRVIVKYNANGTVEMYKSKLVAKGFTQTYGVDYHDTFAPVAKMNTVRVLLSLAVNLDWTLRQFDVKNAFLHGELEEEVYMSLPPGYRVTDEMGNVCKLKNALYELKQFPRVWFGRFPIAKKKFGYQQANTDHTLFIKHRTGKYVMDLLAYTGMFDCKPADTPIVENHKLGVYVDHVPTNKERYQSEDHMAAVMRILSYLKSAPGRGLLFKENDHLDLEGYIDANYEGNITDRRSTSSYFTFGGNLVTWHNKKQNVVSRFSVEFEYRRIGQGVCEILWLRWLLAEIGFRLNAATKLHCNNQSAFEIANNLVQHDRTKHVEVDWHFIKEKLEHKLIFIPFVHSSEQLADMLTHAVSKHRFEDLLDKLGITDIYTPI